MNEDVNKDLDELFDVEELRRELLRVRTECAERIREVRNKYRKDLKDAESYKLRADRLLKAAVDLDYKIAKYTEQDLEEAKEIAREKGYEEGIDVGEDNAYLRFHEEEDVKVLNDSQMDYIISKLKEYNALGYENPYRELLLELGYKHGYTYLITGDY